MRCSAPWTARPRRQARTSPNRRTGYCGTAARTRPTTPTGRSSPAPGGPGARRDPPRSPRHRTALTHPTPVPAGRDRSRLPRPRQPRQGRGSRTLRAPGCGGSDLCHRKSATTTGEPTDHPPRVSRSTPHRHQPSYLHRHGPQPGSRHGRPRRREPAERPLRCPASLLLSGRTGASDWWSGLRSRTLRAEWAAAVASGAADRSRRRSPTAGVRRPASAGRP